MKVKCKYGEGVLVGINSSNHYVTYKVLLELSSEHVAERVEDRIYHAFSIDIESESGEWVGFIRDKITKPNH